GQGDRRHGRCADEAAEELHARLPQRRPCRVEDRDREGGNELPGAPRRRLARRDLAPGNALDRLSRAGTVTLMSDVPGVNPSVPPSGEGCADCLAGDGPGWWLHLRRCTECGHVGCCDSSPSQHARGHSHESGHPYVQSFEPGEDWFWSFPDDGYFDGPE